MRNIKFYERLHNEDCEPYADDSMLVVADGLGGSGSALHHIDNEELFDMNTLRAYVIGNCFNDEFNAVLDQIFSAITYGNGEYTSAMIASRIVMARYVYELKNNILAFKQMDFSKKIRNSLETFAMAYDLDKDINNQALRLLPTTLASIVFDDFSNKVYAVWAGDSRCYYLGNTSNGNFGLKHLSIDDEDEDGSINNLCYLGKKETIINYREYSNFNKGIYFVASDGLFDILSNNAELELIIYKAMFASTDFDSFELQLSTYYNENKSDDCSCAMRILGFNSYDSMKDYYKERYLYLLDLENLYKKYESIIYVKENPTIEEELYDYMFERLQAKKPKFIQLVLESVDSGDIENPWLKNNDKLKEIFRLNKSCYLSEDALKSIILYSVKNDVFSEDLLFDINTIFGNEFVKFLKNYIERKKTYQELCLIKDTYQESIARVIGHANINFRSMNASYYKMLYKNNYIVKEEDLSKLVKYGIKSYQKNKRVVTTKTFKDDMINQIVFAEVETIDESMFNDKDIIKDIIRTRLKKYDGTLCDIDRLFNESRFSNLAKIIQADLNNKEFISFYDNYKEYCQAIYDLV